MTPIRVQIDIDATPEQVWEVVRDIADHVHWMHDAYAIRFTSERREGVGTTFDCDTRVGPLRLTDKMAVTEWVEAQAMGVRHEGIVTGTGRFTLEPGPGGTTRFSWAEGLDFPWWMGAQVGEAAGRPVLTAIWRRNLANLKARVEAHVRAQGRTRQPQDDRPAAGYLSGGLPYNRLGNGPLPLVIFQGLMFENKPQGAATTRMYRFLGRDYTVYSVLRRPGLPQGATFADMADDYAAMIRSEFGGPVDVIGVSTGGLLALQFAADHPDLVRRLVVHSAAYQDSPAGAAFMRDIQRLAAEERWREVWQTFLAFVLQPAWYAGVVARVAAPVLARNAPADPSDLVTTIAAELEFDFRDRLGEIAAPTLVIAGDQDCGCTPEQFRDTAAGIPDARLVLYPGMGHPASGPAFERDVLAFLREP